MSKWFFAFAWVFIAGVAGYDSAFAWQYRSVLPSWELNPLAVWAAQAFGLSTVLGFKFVALSFALGIAVYCRRRRCELERPITLIISAAYGLLLLHYSIGFMKLDR